MKFSAAIVLGCTLGALGIPVLDLREKTPYEMPSKILDKQKIDILKPVKGSGDNSPRKAPVGGYKDLRLKDEITLAWKNPDTFTEAVLKANWKETPDMKVINMEDFGDLVEDVDCTAPHMFIDFKQAADISNAIREWGWVNEQSKHKLVVFANHPKCGDEGSREPYLVTAIKYDKKEFRADMQVEPIKDFESVIPDGVIEIDTLIDPNEAIPPSFFSENPDINTSPATPLARRADVTKTLSLNHNLSGNIFRISKNNNYVSLDCTDCGTRGSLRAKAYVRISWFQLKEAYVEFRTSGVEIRVNLLLEAHIEHHITDHKVLVPLMVYVGIPKIIALRFGANIGVGWDIGFEATGRVGWGITGRMADSLYRNCLKGCIDKNEGWTFTWEKKKPTASGEIRSTVDVHAFINPNFGVDLFGHGYEGGVAFLAPQFLGDVAILADTEGGICNNPATVIGLDVELAYGFSAFAYAGFNYQDTHWQANIFPPKKYIFYDECFSLKDKSVGTPVSTPVSTPTVTHLTQAPLTTKTVLSVTTKLTVPTKKPIIT